MATAVTKLHPLVRPRPFAALSEVGAELDRGDTLDRLLDRALGRLANLAPDQVARTDGAIAAAASLCRQLAKSLLSGQWSRYLTRGEQLGRTPGLAYLFSFHRDGHIREAALNELTGGLPSPVSSPRLFGD